MSNKGVSLLTTLYKSYNYSFYSLINVSSYIFYYSKSYFSSFVNVLFFNYSKIEIYFYYDSSYFLYNFAG